MAQKKMEDKKATKNSNTQLDTMLSLLSLVSNLHAENLITDDEKQRLEIQQPIEMKAAIFDLLSTKDFIVAAKVLMRIRCNSEPRQVQNPLKINKIISHLFGLLRFEDLKNCRAVCKIWNYEAEPLIRKASAITFGHLNSDVRFMNRRPENFLQTFRHFSLSTTNIPFTTFRFLSTVEWRIEDFKNFFEEQKEMKNLQLHGVRIVNENGKFEKEYDISDWFADFSVSELTVRCHSYFYKPPTLLALSVDVLRSITHINLNACKLKIRNERPITPITIKLTNLRFWRDGGLLQEYVVNDLIDFSKAKDITIICPDSVHHFTTPILDLSKCLGLNAKQMSLNRISVVNWKDCKGVVKTLELRNIPFKEKTPMEIKELHIIGSSIDLFALPFSLEKLYLDSSEISSSQPVDLFNLKKLLIETEDRLDLNFFANCPNLVDIGIQTDFNCDLPLDLESLPKSVKRMTIQGIKGFSGRRLILEKLGLINYSLANAAEIIMNITPKVLVLHWGFNYEYSGSVLSFLQRFEGLVLFIGPFYWDDTNVVFEKSPLMPHVDQKAEYYVFENNQGRSLPSIHHELLL